MDLNSALDILIKDLRDAREIINDLRHIKGVPLIQVEIAKAKCRSAEEIIELLKSLYPDISQASAQEAGDESTTQTPMPGRTDSGVAREDIIIIEEVSQPADEKAETRKPIPEVETTKPRPETDTTKPRPEAETKKTTPVTEPTKPLPETETEKPAAGAVTTDKSTSKKSAPVKKGEGKPILADRFSDAGNRVNERIKEARTEDDITSRMNRAPVTNLADAIGINEKFYFIREIFGGDSHSYNSAIARLNEINGLPEAETVINELAGNDADQGAVKTFLEIVKRKTGIDG